MGCEKESLVYLRLITDDIDTAWIYKSDDAV